VLPLVISLEDTRAGTTARYAFIRSPVHLGRREDNDVALDDPFVSARHGLLQFDECEVRYTDLGSCNGSVLDGRRLASHAQARLGPGAVLRIGSLVLTFSRGTPEPAAVGVRGDESVRPGKITALMAQLARTPVVGAAEAWAGSLRPGLVIGRFELQREVGRGGFGIVFEARDRQLGRSVALKAVRPRAGVRCGATLRRDLPPRLDRLGLWHHGGFRHGGLREPFVERARPRGDHVKPDVAISTPLEHRPKRPGHPRVLRCRDVGRLVELVDRFVQL
jgi:hypothetical protein